MEIPEGTPGADGESPQPSRELLRLQHELLCAEIKSLRLELARTQAIGAPFEYICDLEEMLTDEEERKEALMLLISPNGTERISP